MRGRRINRKANTAAMLAHTIRTTLARKLAAAAVDNRDNPSPVALDTSYGKFYLSGVFYRLFEGERHGHLTDFDDYAFNAFNRAQAGDKPYRVSIHNPRAAVLLLLRKAIATDYANWKHAFGLEHAAPKDQ